MGFLKRVLRWLCVPVVYMLVLAAGAVAGAGVVRLMDARCAPDAMAGGACVAPWHTTAIEWVVYVGLFVSVVLAVFLSARVAPSARFPVAVIGGLLAAALPAAVWLGAGWSDFRLVTMEALVAAAVGAWPAWRRRAINAGIPVQPQGSV
jgi:hypothetical protein